ncbi:MAG: inorganic phosphate transporter [Candidatus Methanomethyliales bacterium]|nr:inorganic phosphate transporter [Candidatus Methanomethylicales archaeon]
MSAVLVILTSIMLVITGANNASNSAGTVAGSKITSYRNGILIFILGITAGAVLEGWKLSNAVQGKALQGALDTFSLEVVMGVTFATLVLATTLRLPLPITQALYGASLGSALYVGIPIDWSNVTGVFLSWIATPVSAMFIAYVLTKVTSRLTFNGVQEAVVTYGFLTIATSFYTAYALGANTLGLIVGVVGTDLGSLQALILAVVATALGGFLMGERVSRTVGEGMASLGPATGFSSQLSAALVVHLFTQAGIPVSISHSVIGGVLGGGLGKGLHALGKGLLARLVILWTLVPGFSLVMAWIMHGAILG